MVQEVECLVGRCTAEQHAEVSGIEFDVIDQPFNPGFFQHYRAIAHLIPG